MLLDMKRYEGLDLASHILLSVLDVQEWLTSKFRPLYHRRKSTSALSLRYSFGDNVGLTALAKRSQCCCRNSKPDDPELG